MRRPLRLALLALAVPVVLGLASPARAAPWCGTASPTDRAPAVAGYQIRVVYAIASDGTDSSAGLAPQISADVDAIEDWWRAQDPVRAPRFDRALYSCGAQVDIRVVRLPQPTAQLQPEEGRFAAIAGAVQGSESRSPFLKYLVYLDAQLDSSGICGQGGGSFGGEGVAIVYPAACAGEPTAVVAVHELIHSLGALPAPGPPHPCSAQDPGHPCDSSADILWPFATLTPLASLVLDVGRDDYYGHDGSWPDLQDSLWLRKLDAQAQLSLVLEGSGQVRSDIPGVDCAATCTTEWDTGSQIQLTATAPAGQRFVRWGGACTGTTSQCALALSEAALVSAVFAPVAFPLTVLLTGKGSVRGASGGVRCPARCVAQLPSFAPAVLTAKPARGWRFRAWRGGCRGSSLSCTVPMSAATAVRATFARKPAPKRR